MSEQRSHWRHQWYVIGQIWWCWQPWWLSSSCKARSQLYLYDRWQQYLADGKPAPRSQTYWRRWYRILIQAGWVLTHLPRVTQQSTWQGDCPCDSASGRCHERQWHTLYGIFGQDWWLMTKMTLMWLSLTAVWRPETQPIMMRLKGSMVDLIALGLDGNLPQQTESGMSVLPRCGTGCAKDYPARVTAMSSMGYHHWVTIWANGYGCQSFPRRHRSLWQWWNYHQWRSCGFAWRRSVTIFWMPKPKP